tara:strand:- start:1263 stop:3686 length:2424 start_codon:yes stop_codon:yes gene_type:complete
MASAPYQLWMDLPQVTSVSGASGTATVTTVSSHGLTVGAYVQIEGVPAPLDEVNGVVQITAVGGTTFSYAVVGVSGTALSGTDLVSTNASVDLLNPPSNYSSGSSRQEAFLANISGVNMFANGDGSGATMSIQVYQDLTPSVGPWFKLIPDQARVRFALADTGTAPVSSDILFLGNVSSMSSKLNGSGLGTETDVSLADVNAMLDRVVVFGKSGSVNNVESASRNSSGVATIITTSDHGFVVGQKVTIAGVSGGGTATFNTASAAITSVSSTTSGELNKFTYANAGAAAVDGADPVRYNVSLDGKSRTSIILTTVVSTSNAWVNDNEMIWIFNSTLSPTGFTDNTTVANLIYDGGTGGKPFPGALVKRVSNTSFRVTLEGALPGTAGAFTGAVRVQTLGRTWDSTTTGGQTAVIIKSGTTETNAVKQMLSVANAYHSVDYAMKRLLNTSDSTKVNSTATARNTEAIYFPSSTLRGALDTVIENWQGTDLYSRRYYVNPQAQLVYELVDTDQIPTNPTAPYKIVTTSAGTPDLATDQASIAPYSLSVSWDHDTIKRAQFNVPSTAQNGGQVATVIAYGNLKTVDGNGDKADRYPNRPNAPLTEAIVDFPTAASAVRVRQAAAAWFKERKEPLMSGYLELHGGGSLSHNLNGFLVGFRKLDLSLLSAVRAGSTVTITTKSSTNPSQDGPHGLRTGDTVVLSGITGASGTTMNGTYTITVTTTSAFTYTSAGTAGNGTVTSATGYAYAKTPWAPGQWVDITAPGLGLSGKYRVEQVGLGFEPGSYIQIVGVTFNRKSPADLAAIIAGQRS